LNNRGNLYWSKHEDDRAFQDFNEAIRINPRVEYLANRGEKYDLLGDNDHVISDFDRVISLNPQLAIAYKYRGDAYAQKKTSRAPYKITIRHSASSRPTSYFRL